MERIRKIQNVRLKAESMVVSITQLLESTPSWPIA